jgi:hypothetical protein
MFEIFYPLVLIGFYDFLHIRIRTSVIDYKEFEIFERLVQYGFDCGPEILHPGIVNWKKNGYFRRHNLLLVVEAL